MIETTTAPPVGDRVPVVLRLMQACPWTNGRLKKLGDCIRDDVPIPADVPAYGEVMLWYNDIAAEVQRDIEALDWSPLLGDRQPEVTSRPKTIDTLREKLIRLPRMSLPEMQDIAGVRFDAEMTLDEQDGVANAIAGIFKQDLSACLRDIRPRPHSGYRGGHLWLRLEGRAEVQIRTHLQSEWSNMYEAAGDLFGRGIRYDERPATPEVAALIDALQGLSTSEISDLEQSANVIQKLEMRASEGEARLARGLDGPQSADDLRASEEGKRKLGVLKKRHNNREIQFRAQLAKLRYSFENAERKGT